MWKTLAHAAGFVAIMAGIGCGDNDVGPIDASPFDARQADAHTDAFVTVASQTGIVTDQRTGAPIGGAKVCADGLDQEYCAVTAQSGLYSLHIPFLDGPSKITQITSAAGYLGRDNLLVEDPTPANGHLVAWETVGGLYSTADATTLLQTEAGFVYPSSSTGFVLLAVYGATTGDLVTATAFIGAATGTGPVYYNSAGLPNPSQTDTSIDARILFGNMVPGTYELTVVSPGKTCSAMTAGGTINNEWPPVASGTLSVNVTANAITTGLAVTCI